MLLARLNAAEPLKVVSSSVKLIVFAVIVLAGPASSVLKLMAVSASGSVVLTAACPIALSSVLRSKEATDSLPLITGATKLLTARLPVAFRFAKESVRSDRVSCCFAKLASILALVAISKLLPANGLPERLNLLSRSLILYNWLSRSKKNSADRFAVAFICSSPLTRCVALKLSSAGKKALVTTWPELILKSLNSASVSVLLSR